MTSDLIPTRHVRPLVMFVIGGPGSGKGTQVGIIEVRISFGGVRVRVLGLRFNVKVVSYLAICGACQCVILVLEKKLRVVLY